MKTFRDILEKARKHESYWIESALYDFTETICELMESSNMNRTELARRLDVSPAYITKLLRGNANVTIKTMVRLSRVFGRELHITLHEGAAQQARVSVGVSDLSTRSWPTEKTANAPPMSQYKAMPSATQQEQPYEKEPVAA